MAIYHCHCKMISRGKGRSAVGAAAYRSGEKLTNEYDGLEHDYSKKGGVVYSEIMLCENAPQAYQDRATLWNAVEQIEKSSNAQLAREYEIALPVELKREEQIQLVRDFVKDSFVDKGMCADFAIHDKKDGNPHAHIMLTTRPIEKDGTWGAKATNEYVLDKNGERILQKVDKQNRKIYKRVKIETTDWSTKDFLQRNRESWAVKINAALQKKNLPQRVDHRSFKDQGKEQIPTQHIGVSANAMEKRGIESQRGNENREIKAANSEVKALSFVEKDLQKKIGCIRDDIRWNKVHEGVAEFEKALPKFVESRKGLQILQEKLENLKESASHLKPYKASEGRTVEYDLRQIPYFDYHKNKVIADISYLQDKVKGYAETLEQKRQTEPKQEQAKPAPAEQKPTPPAPEPQRSFNAAEVAHRLALLRSEFIRETAKSGERTSYQPNPIYSQQAGQIDSYAKAIREQTVSINSLKAEQGKLGMFKGKEKKELQGKIDNFERLRRENMAKLNALGVSDPSKAEEAVKEKMSMAAQEQAKAQAAKLNEGADRRAAEAKEAYYALAQTVPADQRQEVRSLMEQYREGGEGKGMNQIKAEIEALKQLEPALQEQDGGKDRQQKQERTRWNDREH